MIKLYDHQKKIIDEDKKQCGLFLGTGSGKTRTALMLAGVRSILVIAPKIQVQDRNWQRELEKMHAEIDYRMERCGIIRPDEIVVISYETFKRDWRKLPRFNTVILDEAHRASGVSPTLRQRNRRLIPKASQTFEAIDEYLTLMPPLRLYLATATPARNAMAVWALAKLLGRKWDWYKFRETFYFRTPMNGREIWMQKKDKESKERLANCVKHLGYVGRIDDYFDVPEQTTKYVHCPLSDEQKKAIEDLPLYFPDPLVLVGKTHQIENGFLIQDPTVSPQPFLTSKLDALDDLFQEYPKMLVFARFREQINQIADYFMSQNVKVFVLTGDAKDRDTMFKDAEAVEECVFIAQAQISTGYELPSFRCTVFASASYSTVDNTQALGRTLRANALNKNLYVYLQSGEIDKAVINCLKNHEDFNEKLYAKKLNI